MKRTDAEMYIDVLESKLPLELVAEIATYRDAWCGATQNDALCLLKLWKNFQPQKLNWK